MLRRKETIRRQELIQSVQNAGKLRYQPQIPDVFAPENMARQSQFEVSQQQNTIIGGLKKMMLAMESENDIQTNLDRDQKKRATEGKSFNVLQLRADQKENC